MVAWLTAFAFAVGYCAIVAWHYHDWRVLAAAGVYVVPAITVGGLAFVQRLCFGGRTKRITRDTITSCAGTPSHFPIASGSLLATRGDGFSGDRWTMANRHDIGRGGI